MKKTKPTLDGFKKKISPFQQELLQKAWEQFHLHAKWPAIRQFYSEYGKDTVRKALSSLTGNVGTEDNQSSSPWRVYRLSLLGVLLTRDGLKFKSLLLRFLELQRASFINDPLKSHFEASDIGKILNINENDLALLGQLLYLGHLGGSEARSTTWGANVMREAEDFPDGDLSSKLEEVIFQYL